MKVICVGGTSSACGKTSVVSLLLKVFPGWGAVKVTPCRVDRVCPHADDCGACSPPDGGYEIISDEAVLARAGTDTARFMEAGASRVAWVRSLRESLPEALGSALGSFCDTPGVIVESTTAIPLLDGLNVLVIREGADEAKESARACLDRVDLTALNMAEPRTFSSGCRAEASMSGVGRVIPMCAILPLEHRLNRAFLAAVSEFSL